VSGDDAELRIGRRGTTMNGYGTTQELFTIVPAATLCGLTFSTVVVTNAIGKLFGTPRRWIGLAVAVLSSIGLTFALSQRGDFSHYLAAISNGLFIYFSAVGLMSSPIGLFEQADPANVPSRSDRFWARWD
jgi:hypothetical protein